MTTEIFNIKKNHIFSFTNLFIKNNLSTEQKQLVKKAQLFLDTNNYLAVFKMISQGYIPSKRQEQILKKHVNRALAHGYSNMYDVEKYLKTGLTLSFENVIQILCKQNSNLRYAFARLYKQDKKFITLQDPYGEEEPNYLPLLTQEIYNIINQQDFSIYLSKLFTNDILHIPYSSTKKNHYEYVIKKYSSIIRTDIQLLFQYISFEDFLIINKKIQRSDIENDYKNIFTNIFNEIYKDDINNILNETKINYTTEMVNNLTVNNIKQGHYDIKDLPVEALDLIKSIEETYQKIQNMQTKLSENMLMKDRIDSLNILLEKRIPEVLGKYLTIDPSYRTTLMSIQGKNAEQLMIESLNNIAQSFIVIFEEINQQSVDSLSVTNRYTQALNQ